MPLQAFSQSKPLTLGVELELQLLSTNTYDLVESAEDLLRIVSRRDHPGEIKPEMTRSMIEISTSVQSGYQSLLGELRDIRGALLEAARFLNIAIAGGGTHPFQHWGERKIFDAPRFNHLSELYGYLAKQFTIFGQHVHIGCSGPDEALRLLHLFGRYIPQFIALTASSPMVQGFDTQFDSARLNSVFSFPLSGRAPYVLSWTDFGRFYNKMTGTGVVESMKDFYWDIRPKPEYGTIEIRVCDTPLTVEKAAALAGYVQSIARYLLVEAPFRPDEDDYLVYAFNRFQACRFGLDGQLVDPRTHERIRIGDDIVDTLARIEQHAIELGAEGACKAVRDSLAAGNDAQWIRQRYAAEKSLPEVVRQQSEFWAAGK